MKAFGFIPTYEDSSQNSIKSGADCKFSSSKVKFLQSGASILVGDGCNISVCEFTLGVNATVVIGDNVHLRGTISIGANSSLIIGNGLRVTSNCYIRATESTVVTIGDGCLFGSNIIIRTTDGHPIYDSTSRQRLNKSKSIEIGRHVWIADEVVVLKGVKIGECSVIAMRSLVNKDIPEKCIAAGVPAKVVRENVVWEHDTRTVTEEFYDG